MLLSSFIILLSVALYGLVHSLLASMPAKARVRRWFGRLADRWYRIFYNLFGVISFVPVLALLVLLPDTPLYTIPFPWLALTSMVQIAALLALLVGVVQTGAWSFLGIAQLLKAPGEGPNELIVQGLYRWVRHPLYTAGLAFIYTTPRMTINLLALNVGLTLYIVVGAYFEERKLLREYGEAYREYSRRTPMLIPYKWPAPNRPKPKSMI